MFGDGILPLFDGSYEAISGWYCMKRDMMLKQDGIGDSFDVGVLHDNIIAEMMFEHWSDVKTCLCMHSSWLLQSKFHVYQTFHSW